MYVVLHRYFLSHSFTLPWDVLAK